MVELQERAGRDATGSVLRRLLHTHEGGNRAGGPRAVGSGCNCLPVCTFSVGEKQMLEVLETPEVRPRPGGVVGADCGATLLGLPSWLPYSPAE